MLSSINYSIQCFHEYTGDDCSEGGGANEGGSGGPGSKRGPFTVGVRGQGPGSKRGPFTAGIRGPGSKRGLFTLGVGIQTRAVHWVQQPGWGSGVQTRAVQRGSEGRDHRGPNEGCSQQGSGLPGSKRGLFTGP